MYKKIAVAALAGVVYASPALEAYPSKPGNPSVSICTETSTLIFRSSTEYSTYYVTHTLGPSGYPAPSGYPSGGAPPAYPSKPVVTDVTTIYVTTCPVEHTWTSGTKTGTSTSATVSTLTSTYKTTITPPAYPPVSPATESTPAPYTSVCTETSTLIYQGTTKYATYLVTHTSYPGAPGTPPASPATTGAAAPPPAPYPGSPAAGPSSPAGGIGSWIASPSPASPASPALPPVVSYPAGNATTPGGKPTGAGSGWPMQQTGNAGVVNKPVGALVGLAGLAFAVL